MCQFFQVKAVEKRCKSFGRETGLCKLRTEKSIKKPSLYHIFGTKFAYKSKKHLLFADFSLKAKKG
ncbi:MAG: hypothetical protein SPG65_08385 [Campylobacter sp.]|nr:hypothetical protein [Campylobacter sp.]